ncbi:uncharacterized protein LOC108344991 isoform X6 [Vigna angularis]|uniref:uncharacterized protein LOC108344991 isoform X6 n=1 Tax=Phaseolus angularis TaxID=3914 RepID=UPI0022B534A0|nr:uncharacterized protein LOC108344991 isoform X6 [Vigna angularis]
MEEEAFSIVSTYKLIKFEINSWILKFVALSPLEHNLDLGWRLKALILSLANPKWNGLLKGVSHAKLVAQKSKGMPLITIPLTKVVDCTAMEVKLNFCSSLFDAFKMKSMECSLVKGVRNLSKKQEHSARTNMLAAEKERNESIQLEQRQKFQKISDLDNGVSTEGLQNSPDKQATRHGGSTKVKNRKVPAYRSRTKVRGALLHDNEE